MVNVPRRSSTFSAVILGTWKSVVMSSLRCFFSELRVGSGLLGVQLDDQLLLDRRRDLAALGVAKDLGGQGVMVGLKPSRDGRNQFRGATNGVGRAGGRFDRDDVLG